MKYLRTSKYGRSFRYGAYLVVWWQDAEVPDEDVAALQASADYWGVALEVSDTPTEPDDGAPPATDPDLLPVARGDVDNPESAFRQALDPVLAATYAPREGALPGGSWAFLGDSITTGTAASSVGGFASFCSYLSDYRVRVGFRAGHAGLRSDQLLPYVASEVAPSGARTCFVLAGANDASQSVPLATFAANMEALCDALAAAGVTPILGTVLPQSAAKRTLIGSYNAWLRSYAAAQQYAVVGLHAALVDPATGALAAPYDSGDALHPNLAGHVLMARTILDTVGALIPPATVPLASAVGDATNLLANPLFLTDANADGLGDSWGNTGTAAPAWALVADPDRWVGNAQKVPITGGAYRRLEQTVNAGFAPGDVLAWGCVFALENIVGDIYGIKFDRVDTGGAGATVVPVGGIDVPVDRGAFWTTWTVPAGTTSFKVRHVADCTGGTSADFYFAQATLLNLTALGLA